MNYKEFNGTWFKSFVDGEFQGNKLSVKAATKCSLEQYHEAIYNAVKAKITLDYIPLTHTFMKECFQILLMKYSVVQMVRHI